MTIWLLALLLLASLAGLGYRQGAVRVAFSLVGILLGAVLAVPLGKLVKPLLLAVGLKNPTLVWALAPLIVFLLISIAFKIAALPAHHKVDVYFKYHAGDLRLALWERLSHRLGLCLGLINGAVYFILISAIIYVFSYWTVQVATADTDPKLGRTLNRLGRDLQGTGFDKVAYATAHVAESFYDTADVAGLIYNNPLTEARLYRYPAFLGLAERPEFQDLSNDKDFAEMRARREPVVNVLKYPKAQAIVSNPDLLKLIWATVVPDVRDLRVFLETGKSPKYDQEKILGRWRFDVNAAIGLLRKAKPNISSIEMQKVKKGMALQFSRTGLVAMTDHKAILKNVPQIKLTPAGVAASSDTQTMEGQWEKLDDKYLVSLTTAGRKEELPTTVEGDRLMVSFQGQGLAFTRED